MTSAPDDYLLLRPERATAIDLLRLLFSSDLSANRAVDCPPNTNVHGVFRRWPIFVSLLLQMIILALRKPIAAVGYALEFSLNLVTCNGGWRGLLRNAHRGRINTPNQRSPTYRSITGLIDTRFKSIMNENPSHTISSAVLCIMAAKLAYEKEMFIRNVVTHEWQMKFLELYDCWNEFQGDYSAQAIIFCDKIVNPNIVVLAFSGNKLFDSSQLCSYIDFSWYEIPNVGKVHAGAMEALGLQRGSFWPKEIGHKKRRKTFAYYGVRKKLKDFLEINKGARLLITGHSFGGALAIIFAAILALHEEAEILDRVDGVYTYGQLRAGDSSLGNFIESHLNPNKYFRYVYCNDIVPNLPYDSSGAVFQQFGLCRYFNSFYRVKASSNERRGICCFLFNLIPSYWNFWWELTRGLIIGYIFGSVYKEGLPLILVRALRVAIPILQLHTVQDYVNSARFEDEYHHCSR